ncbi:MAG: SH3 domain-containing protein [Anaerolineae bacterium]
MAFHRLIEEENPTMRVRALVLLTLLLTLLGAAACTGSRISRRPTVTPVPTKTLRPTFTSTPVKPTLTPSPTAALQTPTVEVPVVSPTAAPPTPEPPTPVPTPVPVQASFTVASATLNVRGGPGTNYNIIGQIRQGQTFPITGKNQAGNWWQFDYNGRPGWVWGQLVRVTNAEVVQVAQNIPAPPTPRPLPAAVPQPPAPQPPAAAPAPTFRFGLTGKSQLRANTNSYVTVWCFVINRANSALTPGTLRVTRNGVTLQEQTFLGGSEAARGDAGYSSEFLYNPNCKVELPAADGNYTAYLIENGQQISDAFSFTVSGESNRTAIIEWREK